MLSRGGHGWGIPGPPGADCEQIPVSTDPGCNWRPIVHEKLRSPRTRRPLLPERERAETLGAQHESRGGAAPFAAKRGTARFRQIKLRQRAIHKPGREHSYAVYRPVMAGP